jgi:signal transduction histidine kinase
MTGPRSFGLAGRGLGLAIAKRTIDAHKGRIITTCRAGMFLIGLPLTRATGEPRKP